MTPWTEEDFPDDVFEQLCKARLRNDRATWYRLLRSHCGYTAGRYQLRGEIKMLVDAWLARHPSWTGRYV